MSRESGVLAAACAAMIAAVATAGWVVGSAGVQSFWGAQPMLPVTAAAVFVGAVGLVRLRGLGVPLIIGGVAATVDALAGGERTAINSAACVVLVGVALLALD